MNPTKEQIAIGAGVIDERAAVLVHLRGYIKGVADLSALPVGAAATDVIQLVVNGIVESLERLYRSIEDGEHRSQTVMFGSRGTNFAIGRDSQDNHPDETFIAGTADELGDT